MFSFYRHKNWILVVPVNTASLPNLKSPGGKSKQNPVTSSVLETTGKRRRESRTIRETA